MEIQHVDLPLVDSVTEDGGSRVRPPLGPPSGGVFGGRPRIHLDQHTGILHVGSHQFVFTQVSLEVKMEGGYEEFLGVIDPTDQCQHWFPLKDFELRPLPNEVLARAKRTAHGAYSSEAVADFSGKKFKMPLL